MASLILKRSRGSSCSIRVSHSPGSINNHDSLILPPPSNYQYSPTFEAGDLILTNNPYLLYPFPLHSLKISFRANNFFVPSSVSGSHVQTFSNSVLKNAILSLAPLYGVNDINSYRHCSYLLGTAEGISSCRLFGTLDAVEPSKSHGHTVDEAVANQLIIDDEKATDWKGHAAAVSQSIAVIKKRLRWKTTLAKSEQLSMELDKPGIWDDPVRAEKISREHASLMKKIEEVKKLEQDLLEHVELLKLAREENDVEIESESLNALIEMKKKSKDKEQKALLSGENDSYSCFIEVQSGAGGTESMDFASMLFKMYTLWAQRHGYKVTVVDEMPGDAFGIKRGMLKVDGEYAFGYAKAEVGTHRLVRISPFDSQKRRHTSFAAVAVVPISSDAFSHVQIKQSDIRIDTYRSGGPGGQHANTTDSAVRIVHIPTGIIVTCQNERSQHRNKESAMAVLQSRVDQLEQFRRAQSDAKFTECLADISWGTQIRSYVLHPYLMVKDLRTNYEVTNPQSVFAGDLDTFIYKYLAASLDNDANPEP